MFGFFRKRQPPTPPQASAQMRGPDGWTDQQRYLMSGIDAYKAKRWVEAESLLRAAMNGYRPNDSARRTALVHLGMIFRRTNRDAEAVAALEQALPLPAAFDELKGLYRAMAKAAKKQGDHAAEKDRYRKLYSVSMIEAMICEQRLPFAQQESWMEQLRAKVYWYQPDSEGVKRIEQSTILSATDCKAIRDRFGL